MIDDAPDIQVRVQPDDRVAVVIVVGEIDLATAHLLDEAVARAAGSGARRTVVVDLSETRYLDSSGFRVLHRAAQAGPVTLVVPAASPVARAVGIVGLPTLVSIFPSIDAALLEQSPPSGWSCPRRPRCRRW